MNAMLPRNDGKTDIFKERSKINPPIPANSKWRSWANNPFIKVILNTMDGKYSLLINVNASAVGIPENIQGCHNGNSPVLSMALFKAIDDDFGDIVSGEPKISP